VGTGEYSISWLEQTTQTKELPPKQLVTFKVVESSNLYLIVGSCAAIVLGCLLMALLILVYRNQDRAKELVISFIQFEMRALAEAFLEALDIIGKPVLLLLSRLRSTGSVDQVMPCASLRSCQRATNRGRKNCFHLTQCSLASAALPHSSRFSATQASSLISSGLARSAPPP
jgi:hypothetical protein